MPRSRINGYFIDKTFSIVANILLRIILTTSKEKEAFTYSEMQLSAESEGNYVQALQNYYEVMRLEIDPYDRSYILYNIGLIHTSNGKHTKALEYYFRVLERNPFLPQALNNIVAICHYSWRKPVEYWKHAIALTPGIYIEAHNFLKITRRFE